jgi:uncharacterized repeat protein (TIGR01451 family)
VVTVPAGTYSNTAIPLGITVIDDAAVEGNETITYALSAGTGYTLGNTTTCGASVQTSGTYTITNNDARVTLAKQWVDAWVGDDATITLARGATVLETLISDAGSANERDTAPVATPVVVADTLTLSEALAGTNARAYTATLACTGTTDTDVSNGLTIGANDTAITCTFTNTVIPPPLQAEKSFTVISDGVSVSGPKAIPGAIVRYCILITNPSGVTASDIAAADTLPGELAYLPGTAASGADCANATTPEDDDALGADESDPYGVSVTGTTVQGNVATLGPGASFAMAFETRVR